MSRNISSDIPGKLKAAGFTLFFDRISYEPDRPLWCARASRGNQEWSTMGRDLSGALEELEKLTLETRKEWQKEQEPEFSMGSTGRHPL